MRRSFVFRLLSTLVTALLGAGMLATSANAVTNGSLVPDPKTNVPYVVSIWNNEKSNDYKEAEFTCTGTLIAPQVVLTAAHCVTLTTPYFVKVGAGAINDSTSFTAVSSVWVGDKYNSKTHENDIGLLKLVDRFEDIKFPTLASPATAKSINKYSKLRIFGWGMDQNKVYPELLSTSDLALQDALAIKTFGKSFNTKTMMAAGRKIVAENVWSGACYGDSGGPLLTEINGIIVLAGVTSWGSKFCLENKPSIFNRVSFYESQIKNGILALEAQSTVVNRTAPIATIEAELIGQAKPGNTLKCSPGTWKNAVSIQSTWISPARISGSVKADIEVLASDGGSVFKCEVIISSTKASVRRVLSATITGSATLAGNPVISGIPDRATFKSGTTARCEGWNWRTPVDSERVTWFTSPSYSPSVPVNGRQIGTGSSLTFSSSILKDENGRYLICQVTGVKDGFESHFVASKLITTPPSPTIYSVSVNASSLALGGSAYCTYNSYSDVETTQYEWGFESSSGYFSVFTGLSRGRIEITQNLIQQASGRALSCRVTLISSGGQVSKTASTYNTFENLPYTPNVAATISGTPVAGSTAYCNATSNNSYSVTTSYQWGKTSYSGSKSIEGQILGNSSYYTITSTSLSDLAGAYLTCVVTATNYVGNSSGASSIAIAASSVTLPTASAPTVYSQSPSTTSITVKIQIPSITAFNSTTMQAILNVINSPNCTNLQVQPSSTYDCSGLSANTSYIANISTSLKSGTGSTNRSSNLNFTTVGLSNSSLYVCGQSCTGTLTNSQLQYYLSDKRLIEASSAPGGPITSSTCTVSSCSPGTAPALPVACSTGSTERTNLTANVAAQISTQFRYCSAPTDTTAPIISDGTLARTGYAPIIPTSGAAGTSISVRFIASDNIGIRNTSVRLINPSNVVVATTSGSFIAGSVTDGVYAATLATALSGPVSGDTYQIQVQATDASGNSSIWFSLGSFTVSGLLSALTPTFDAPTPIATGFMVKINNYNSNFNWTTLVSAQSQPGATATISVTGLMTVTGMSAGTSATVTVSNTRTGYSPGTSSIVGSSSAVQVITPQFDSASFSPANISIVAGTSSSFSIRIKNTDQVVTSSCGLVASTGSPFVSSVSTMTRISGTLADGIWQCNFTVISSTAAGQARAFVNLLRSNDSWNYSFSGTEKLITITQPNVGDTQKPSITNGFVSTASPIIPGSLITSTFQVTDNVGVTSVGTYCSLSNNGGNNTIVIASGSGKQATLASGSLQSGNWSCNFNLPGDLALGSYGIYAEAIDAAYNWTSRLLIGSINVVAVVVTPVVLIDTELPNLYSNSMSITSASMSQGALGISTNSNFTVSFRATDNIGVTVANMVLDTSCCENVVQRIFLSTFANLISGTSKDGVYSATALFPKATEMQSLKQSWSQGGTEDSMKGCGRYYIRIMLSDAKNSTSWLTLGTIDVVKCTE